MSFDRPTSRSLFDDIVEKLHNSQSHGQHQTCPVIESTHDKAHAETAEEMKVIERLRVCLEAAGESVWPHIVNCLIRQVQDELGGSRHYIPKKPKTVRNEQIWQEMDLGWTCRESGLQHCLSDSMISKIRKMRPADE